MSNTRDVLMASAGPIDEIVQRLNAALGLEQPLAVRTVTSQQWSWQIAEGLDAGSPLVLMDATVFEFDDERLRGFGWSLELHARLRLGETFEQQKRRLDTQALSLMARIGTVLGVRCVALDNLQSVLGQFP